MLLRRTFLVRFSSDWFCEDFASSSWEAVEPGFAEFGHDPADLLFEVAAGGIEEVDELDELWWAEGVDVDLWESFFDGA